MGRRSGFSSRVRAPSPSRAPPRTTAAPAQRAAAPAPAPSAVAPAPAAPQQGGMMRNIATTAAGVAGGHLAANAIMGMVSGGSGEAAPAEQAAPQYQETQQYQQPAYPQPPQQYYQQPYGQQQQRQEGGPCGVQLQDFLHCAQNNYDIALCSGFNQALKDCKLANPGS